MKSTVVRNPLKSVGPSKYVLVYTLHSLENITRYTGFAPNIVFVLFKKYIEAILKYLPMNVYGSTKRCSTHWTTYFWMLLYYKIYYSYAGWYWIGYIGVQDRMRPIWVKPVYCGFEHMEQRTHTEFDI